MLFSILLRFEFNTAARALQATISIAEVQEFDAVSDQC
jgi:hypothetical protein